MKRMFFICSFGGNLSTSCGLVLNLLIAQSSFVLAVSFSAQSVYLRLARLFFRCQTHYQVVYMWSRVFVWNVGVLH